MKPQSSDYLFFCNGFPEKNDFLIKKLFFVLFILKALWN